MPSKRDLQHIDSKTLARLHEFFSGYKPVKADDQPWVNAQLRKIEDEMASRPAMPNHQPPP